MSAAASTPESPASADDPFGGLEAAVVLPTLNEARGLTRTYADLPLARLAALGWKVKVLVVDGGSTDGTLEVARELGLTVLRQRSKGKGAAMREALQWLHERSVRFAVVLDADFTYPGAAIAPMLALLDSGSQLVVGVRYPEHRQIRDPREWVHRIGNAALNYAASQLSLRPILDTCSGLWGVDVERIRSIPLDSDGFDIEAELFLKAYRRGVIVSQIPIVYRQRVGEAKLRAFQDGARILLTILRTGRTRRAPAPAAIGSAATTRLLRTLLSVSFVSGIRNLVLFSPPSRQAEAQGLVTLLSHAGVSPHLVIGPEGIFADSAAYLPSTRSAHFEDDPIVVAMPPHSTAPAPDFTEAVAFLPSSDRLVYLGPPRRWVRDNAGGPPMPSAWLPGPGYRLELRTDRRELFGPLRALIASLDRSTRSKELALLGANAFGSVVFIWRAPTQNQKPGVPAPSTLGASETDA